MKSLNYLRLQICLSYAIILIIFVILCSDVNLIKDTFLRQNMDDQGWVPISLIAGFQKVKIVSCLWCP